MDVYTKEFWKMLDELFITQDVVIDRAKDTPHPKYPDYIYPLDYGYLSGTVSSDGAGIDVWVGTSEERRPVAVITSVDFVKKDSEIKILYACTTDEIEKVYHDHNRTEGMKGILSIREV